MLSSKQILELLGKQTAEIYDLQGQVAALQEALKTVLEAQERAKAQAKQPAEGK